MSSHDVSEPDAAVTKPVAEEEEDDYMSMSFEAPTQPSKQPESSIQRRARLQREGQARARVKSKAEIAAEEAAAREAALAKSLDSSNRGFQMMAKLGFKGGALGKPGTESRTEPIRIVMKEDRGGVGLDAEKKRKFVEEVGAVEKKVKVEEGDYRERLRKEREEKRLEGQVIGAMIVAEGLESGDASNGHQTPAVIENEKVGSDKPDEAETTTPSQTTTSNSKPLKSINVLWRGLHRHRLEKERERRMRYDLQQSLSRLPTYDDPDEDADYVKALGREEEELEEEDPELDEFNALEPQERLAKLVDYMRRVHNYCFWCKYKYPDEAMEGCPGITEDEHD